MYAGALRGRSAADAVRAQLGGYIGGNIGYGWGRETVSISNLGETTGVPELAGVSLGPVTGNTNGVLGGGQAGCNYHDRRRRRRRSSQHQGRRESIFLVL